MKASALLPPDRAAVCVLETPTSSVAHGIVSQAVLSAPGLRVTLFHFAAGQELSEHTSAARVLVQVLSGTCDFAVDGTTHALKRGCLLHLPPHAAHSVRASEELTLLLTQATPAGAAK